LTLGHIFTTDGVHIATVAQELLVRKKREPVQSERPGPGFLGAHKG
jgi:hypothetical protein